MLKPEKRFLLAATLVAAFALVILFALEMFVRDFVDTARRTSSTNNLKQVGMVFLMYSHDAPEGRYPPPTPRVALAAPDLASIVPEYLDPTFLSVLMVPSWDTGNAPFEMVEKEWPKYLDKAESIVAANHVYFGYAFSTEDELDVLLNAIPELAKRYPHPIERPGGMPILPLGEAKRLSLETPSMADASKTVVIFENPLLNNGDEDFMNVLYLDGVVRIVPRTVFFPNADFARLAYTQQLKP